jgi:hypothetical protein
MGSPAVFFLFLQGAQNRAGDHRETTRRSREKSGLQALRAFVLKVPKAVCLPLEDLHLGMESGRIEP